jgi:hypothetical protein
MVGSGHAKVGERSQIRWTSDLSAIKIIMLGK